MPIHDSSRAPAGLFHHFHQSNPSPSETPCGACRSFSTPRLISWPRSKRLMSQHGSPAPSHFVI